MSFFGTLFSPISALFGGGKKKGQSDIDKLNAQIQPLVDLQKKFAEYGFPAAQESFGAARGSYDFALDFYKKILTGSDDDILNLLNAKEYTKSADESDAMAYNLGGRSGARAAVLGNTQFDRQGVLQGILEQIRTNAPGQIANIGQAISNLGSAQGSLATGTALGSSNLLFGVQQLRENEKDRRANLIASIISLGGSIAGAAAGGA